MFDYQRVHINSSSGWWFQHLWKIWVNWDDYVQIFPIYIYIYLYILLYGKIRVKFQSPPTRNMVDPCWSPSRCPAPSAAGLRHSPSAVSAEHPPPPAGRPPGIARVPGSWRPTQMATSPCSPAAVDSFWAHQHLIISDNLGWIWLIGIFGQIKIW